MVHSLGDRNPPDSFAQGGRSDGLSKDANAFPLRVISTAVSLYLEMFSYSMQWQLPAGSWQTEPSHRESCQGTRIDMCLARVLKASSLRRVVAANPRVLLVLVPARAPSERGRVIGTGWLYGITRSHWNGRPVVSRRLGERISQVEQIGRASCRNWSSSRRRSRPSRGSR